LFLLGVIIVSARERTRYAFAEQRFADGEVDGRVGMESDIDSIRVERLHER